ncbi:MAG: hypothetical protein E5X53_18995 [Mesorhizobium sp.]|uniref:hypothetical protein n=1 Tax=Mesorhizobium sp. TaxID=1871066 RepID=UPI0012203009|nr:hypothetical protein [Mesorhizobium sp.]TIR50619.1 MAG: hypothetical protein E5X53_18995 [Mesorhizobium sp.]
MIEPRDLKPGMVPHWEHAWKGRFDFELCDLAAFVGETLRIDEARLAEGVLRLEFEWSLSDGRLCQLQATFPDSYPFVRPQVALRGAPDTFPEKHCSPSDGNLCLLGRDTGLWPAGWTLATLLEKQLENALNGTGLEDQQGEPMEVWWNTVALSFEGNYMLVDSSWNLKGVEEGNLRVSYSLQRIGERIRFQGAVDEVRAHMRSLASRHKGPPSGLGSMGLSLAPDTAFLAGSNSHTVAALAAAPSFRLRCGKAQEDVTILKRGVFEAIL